MSFPEFALQILRESRKKQRLDRPRIFNKNSGDDTEKISNFQPLISINPFIS
jgi:hypothetical protein